MKKYRFYIWAIVMAILIIIQKEKMDKQKKIQKRGHNVGLFFSIS
jgi:hypothetical protein